MKAIKGHLKFLSILMASVLMLASCTQYDARNQEIGEVQTITGEDLFKSIYFGVGDVTNQITLLSEVSASLNSLTKEQKTEYLYNIDILIAEIQTSSPQFFVRFEQQIKSKDHIAIQSAIQEGSLMIRENLSAISPITETAIVELEAKISSNSGKFESTQEIMGFAEEFNQTEYASLLKQNMIAGEAEACTLFLGCAIAVALYFAAAVHNTAAVAANVYLTFALWGPSLDNYKDAEISPEGKRSMTSLKSEMIVAEIAGIEWD